MLAASKTQGSILVVSTLILSMLAGLSIATMQNVVTEYQLSTHDQDKTLALQSAQYALAEAKRLLLTQWAPGAPTCAAVAGCVNASGVPVSTNGVAVWSYATFASSPNNTDFALRPGSYFTSNAQATPNKPNSKVAIAPRFFVIDLGCDPYSKVNIYRIIAMGFGASTKSTAYAESQLTIPLSGQNAYTNAPTTPVYGVGLTASAVSQQNYNLASSTNSKNLFFKNAGPATCSAPGQSQGTGATCEMNCAGEVRVKAYSSFRNNNTCPWVYGDWVSSGQSTLVLPSDGGNGNVTLSCSTACGTMAVPSTACASLQYDSCAGSCVVAAPAPPPACPGNQVFQSGACTCPPALPNLGSDGNCYAECVGVKNPITISWPIFNATAIPYWNDVQNKCGSCDRYGDNRGALLGLDKPTHLCVYHYSDGTVQVQCSNEQYSNCNPGNILCTKAGQVQKGYCKPRGGITCTDKGNAAGNEICTAWCSKDYKYCPGPNYRTIP